MLLFIISFLLVIIFIVLIYIFIHRGYSEYSVIPASYVVDDVVEVTLSNSELSYIQKNKFVFYKSRKERVEFVSIIRDAYKNRKRNNQVLLRINLDKGEEDLIYISIFKSSRSFVDLLLDCWKE